MIGVDPVAVTLEAAAHGAQEWLHAVAHLPIEQRSEPGLKRRRAPSGAGRAPVDGSGACQSAICASAGRSRARMSLTTAPVPRLKPSQISPSRFSSETAVKRNASIRQRV